MGYRRRIVHYGPGPTELRGELSDRAVAGCWFELHRQGGCGAGELLLKDRFPDRDEVQVGDWIACDGDLGDRWYFGRVEERSARSPQIVRLRLQGMGVELGEVFPGGFGRDRGDGTPPHLFARTDEWFSGDPDFYEQSLDVVENTTELLHLLLDRYVVPQTHVLKEDERIDAEPGPVWSLKFRGEETALGIVKELALRAKNAAWGVDEAGRFYFLKRDEAVQATFQEGVDVLELSSATDFELLVNRVLLTGDFVYNAVDSSSAPAQRLYRWRGNYLQPASRERWGDRRLKMWVPWLRKREDAVTFLREFFRTYSQPGERYLVDVLCGAALPRPWEGDVRLLDRQGNELAKGPVSTIRVRFDHVPRLRLEFGAEDPRTFWPESPTEERYEIAGPERRSGWGGEEITLTVNSSSGPTSSDGTEKSSSSGTSSGTESVTSSSETSSAGTSSSTGSSSEWSSSEISSDESSSEVTSSDLSSSGVTSSGMSESLSSSGWSSSLTSDSFESTSTTSSSGEVSTAWTDTQSGDESGGHSSSEGGDSTGSSEASTMSLTSSLWDSQSSGESVTSSVSDSSSDGKTSESESSAGSSETGSNATSEEEGETSEEGNSSGENPDVSGSDGSEGDSGPPSSESASSEASSSQAESSGLSSGESSEGNSSEGTEPGGETGDSSGEGTGNSGSESDSSEHEEGCLYRYDYVPEADMYVWNMVEEGCPDGTDCLPPSEAGEYVGELRRVPCV